MRIVEDIHKVMDDLRKSVDANGNINLPFILREVVDLFDRIKVMLPSTNEEERKEIFEGVAEMHTFLQGETKRLAVKTGLTEDQMIRFSENPDNFTKEQWNLIAAIKNKMGDQAREIRDVMKGLAAPAIEANPSKEKGKITKARAKKIGSKKDQLRA